MSLPQRIAAYEDCFRIFDRAITRGARVAFATRGEAEYFAMRMQQARSLQRDESKQIYPSDDRRWGKSEYDKLVVRRAVEDDKGEWWIYIQRHDANILAVEDLEETDATLNLD